MARKIKDLIEILSQHVNLDELMPQEVLPEDSAEELSGFVAQAGDIEVWPPSAQLPLENLFPGLQEPDLERVRSAVALVLTNHIGMSREEVFGLLYAEGTRIVWH